MVKPVVSVHKQIKIYLPLKQKIHDNDHQTVVQ